MANVQQINGQEATKAWAGSGDPTPFKLPFARTRPEPGQCASCGQTIEPQPLKFQGKCFWLKPPPLCDACTEKQLGAWDSQERAERARELMESSRLPKAARGMTLDRLDPVYMDRQGRGVEAVKRWGYDPEGEERRGLGYGVDPWQTWRAPYFWSSAGLGKTTLAYVWANRVLLELNKQVLFVSVTDLLRRKRNSFKSGPGQDLVDKAIEAFALVLDDLGGQSMTPWVLEALYVVLDERLKERRPTCITSNYDPAALGEVLIPKEGAQGQDLSPTARALADRVIELCVPVRLGDENGYAESIRLDQASERQGQLWR
jgi:hypothetical protein